MGPVRRWCEGRVRQAPCSWDHPPLMARYELLSHREGPAHVCVSAHSQRPVYDTCSWLPRGQSPTQPLAESRPPTEFWEPFPGPVGPTCSGPTPTMALPWTPSSD